MAAHDEMRNRDADEIFKAEGAADYLKTTVANLARLRHEGGGPPYCRLGRSIRYRRVDLEQWVQANLVGGAR
jgi:hypothetical protein